MSNRADGPLIHPFAIILHTPMQKRRGNRDDNLPPCPELSGSLITVEVIHEIG